MIKVRSGWRENIPAGQMWAILRIRRLLSGLNVLCTSGIANGIPGWA